MFCTDCGREYQDSCNCIHQNKISRMEAYLLLFFVFIVPMVVNLIVLIQIDFDMSNFDFFSVGSISIMIILTVLLLAYYLFNKNYIVLFFGCHQRSNRTLKVHKKHFVLCARCTGILVGLYLSILLSYIGISVFWYLILAIPIFIDGILQHKTDYVSNNTKRFITGILASPTVIILFGGFHYLVLQLGFYIMKVI